MHTLSHLQTTLLAIFADSTAADMMLTDTKSDIIRLCNVRVLRLGPGSPVTFLNSYGRKSKKSGALMAVKATAIFRDRQSTNLSTLKSSDAQRPTTRGKKAISTPSTRRHSVRRALSGNACTASSKSFSRAESSPYRRPLLSHSMTNANALVANMGLVLRLRSIKATTRKINSRASSWLAATTWFGEKTPPKASHTPSKHDRNKQKKTKKTKEETREKQEKLSYPNDIRRCMLCP